MRPGAASPRLRALALTLPWAILVPMGCGRPAPASPSPASPPPATPAPVQTGEEPVEAEAAEPAAAAEAPAQEPPAEEQAPRTMPTGCSGRAKPCVPPSDFVDRLCRDKFPGVAIFMFEKTTPWKRMYVRLTQGVDSMNTLGGPTSEARLEFGEEVIVLRQRGGSGGMQVSGSGGYHVLRWDGTCATVSQDELVPYQPGVPRYAPFVWKYLGSDIQHALLRDKQIKRARKAQREECRGASIRKGKACKRASKQLQNLVVMRVRKGFRLPQPEKVP